MLLTTVSRTLSTSPGGASKPTALEAVQNVDFRLMLPFAFGLNWRAILLRRGSLVLNCVGRFDREFAEFLFVA